RYEYSRSGNPTREALEQTLAALENSKHGLAAESCILHLLSSGDEIICMDDVYGVYDSFGLKIKMVDLCKLENLKAAITSKTKLVWVESPTNPTLKIVDIRGVKDIIFESQKDMILVVDNTFMSPYFQVQFNELTKKPLELGADIVIQSVTKYVNGHSDVVMGSLTVNDHNLHKRLSFYQNAIGAIPSPFDCYLVIRGIKTLSLRMERHQSSAMKIATHFMNHPKIDQVIYPVHCQGLATHPQHDLCKRQSTGFSGMISMRFKGNLESTTKFLEKLS
ncbi:hypothetical protein MXB_3687, partial [Myxobolus squamalis]